MAVLPTLTIFLGLLAVSAYGFLDILGRELQKEVVAVKQPVLKAITEVGSSQCENVKKLFGVEYEQVQGEKEPDLNELTLEFISQLINVTFNITSAAEQIPAARGYDPHLKLILLIHGFTANPSSTFRDSLQSFYSVGETNVLSLDCGSLIKWLYLRSTTYVRFIGDKLGKVLAAIVETGLIPSSIHIVGHSLGSHIASFAGKTFTDLTGKHVGRISGLDPAGPCFSNVEPDLRLKATDADYVDVIHSNAGVFGLVTPVGDADYYPNGGSTQPDCLLETCGHSRAVELFAASIINPEGFPAIRCNDWDSFKRGACEKEISYMGYTSKPDSRGLFFLQTSGQPPFYLGQEGATYHNNEGIVKNIGALGSTLFG